MLGHIVVKTLSRAQGFKIEYTVSGDKNNQFYFNVQSGIDQLHEIINTHGNFDYFINCIGILSNKIDKKSLDSVRTAILVNSLFPHDLAKLGNELGIRIIHISTDGVFGKFVFPRGFRSRLRLGTPGSLDCILGFNCIWKAGRP